jgi:hypothetical protein
MSAQQFSSQSFGNSQTGKVDCDKCRSPIQIREANSVSLEFCVPCQKCGHRGIYYKRMIYIEDASDRRGRPRS